MPGYKGIPSSDPVEQGLRERWYDAVGSELDTVGAELSAYIWNKAVERVAEDKRRFPKAKRNLPIGSEAKTGEGRILP